MNIVKDIGQSLLLNCFGVDDRLYLAVTLMTFFSFPNPDEPISEQELWPFIQEELGKETIFDLAMPKPKGEVLLWGKCFAPEGKAVAALPVEVRVGEIRKSLYVFGNRYWKKSAMAMKLTDPEPFVEMPLVYERAFGGEGFGRNPLGRGMTPVILPSGEEVRPLPNVEGPKHLIGSPGDRPEPAGFAPLDFTWPQRSGKLGTYDDKWLQERWPYFPEDMDWTYFNAAPEDQQMETFFRGGEKFSIRNMHKTKPVIEGRLPSLRHRIFANRLADRSKPEGEKIFREVHSHIDTVWLFPHAERGVIIYRGVTETVDDEALDVTHLYVVTEDPAHEAKTIEVHREEFEKRIDRQVQIPEEARAAQEAARKELAETAERLKDLPQEMADALAAELGRMPTPARTPKEAMDGLHRTLDQLEALHPAQEEMLLNTKARFGHIMKIDTTGFQAMREDLAGARAELGNMAAEGEEAMKGAVAATAEMKEAYKKAMARIDPALLKEKGVAPDITDLDPFKKSPEELWQEQGMRFIERCRDHFLSRPDYLALIRMAGIRPYTLKRAWVGIHPVDETEDPALWGLPAENESRKNPGELFLPGGAVMPSFDGGKLHRIRISSLHHVYPPPEFPGFTFKEGRKAAKVTFVEGSGRMAMVQGSDEGKPFVRVAFEVEALLLHQELAGTCAVIAMANPGVEVDRKTAEFLKNAPQFLIVRYPDSKEPGDTDIEAWKALYPQAEPLVLPKGTNVTEAWRSGVNLWDWVTAVLRPGIAPNPEMKPKDVDLDEPGALASLIPVLDMPAMVKRVRDSMTAEFQAELDLIEKEKDNIIGKARKIIESHGLDAGTLIDKPLKATVPEEASPYASMKKEYMDQFSRVRRQLEKQGVLTPELEKEIARAEKECTDGLARAAAEYEQGMAKLAAAEEQFAAGPPDWAKKLLAGAGMDPDDPEPLRDLTREEVMDRHQKGLTLAGRNLSGLDLSGLDLHHGDFRNANLAKAKLTDANLDGADLSGAKGEEADFSGASIKRARLSGGLFRKARFMGADLSASDLEGAIMNETDLSGANLFGAVLKKVLLEKANLRKANLSQAKAEQANFFYSDAPQADFRGADLTKSMFLESNAEEADFSGALMRSTAFVKAKARKAKFTGADMTNSRIINGSTMTEATFTDVTAAKASWISSDFAGSDFRGAVMKNAIIQECNLAGANLTGVAAREAILARTDLTDAKMEKVNLFRGSLRKAKLVRTNLTRANLYGAEFFRTGVGDTRLEGANLKMTKLFNRVGLLPDKKEQK